MAKKANGKVEYKVSVPVVNTKSCHKVTIPEKALGDAVRWRQSIYLPGQKSGKGLRKFKKATITVILEG